MWAVPHHGTPCYSTAYHCGFPAYIKWYCYRSHNSHWLTISSMFMTPETISFGGGHHGSQEGNTLYQVEEWDHEHYCMTCWMDYTGVEFSIRVNQSLVIDPNPQDMLSQLDRTGSLMQLWWGHLSELVWQSWRIWYWWLEREMQGRGRCREGLSRMSSEGWMIWSIKIGWAASSLIASSLTLLMILWIFLTPLILIRHLTHHDSHTALRQYPLLIESSHWIKSSFHLYPIFPWWVTVFCFITHFLSDISSDLSCCSEKELSGIFLWLIDKQSLTDSRNVA